MIERRTNWQPAAWSLWRLEHDGHDVQCVIGLVPHGFQTRFLHNGKLLSEYIYPSWSGAFALADARRVDFETRGYQAS